MPTILGKRDRLSEQTAALTVALGNTIDLMDISIAMALAFFWRGSR